MTLQYRGKTHERDGAQEVVAGAKWVETRNGMPLVKPYVWRGPRSRIATLTRERVERRLLDDAPDVDVAHAGQEHGRGGRARSAARSAGTAARARRGGRTGR